MGTPESTMASPATKYGTTASASEVLDEKQANLEFIAPYVAEFVGTFLLVFTVGCCVIVNSPTSLLDHTSGLWNATAIGSMLMVVIYAFGPISGGNFNPCVSLALGLNGKLPWPQVGGYIVVQLLGGLMAGCAYGLTFTETVAVAPNKVYPWYDSAMVEIIYTFMICFVVNNCAASKRNNPSDDGNQFFALAIGFVIIAGGYAGGGISGGCFNPAVAIGLDITSSTSSVGWVGWGFAYTLFEVIGAFLAALLFYICRPEDYLPEGISLEDYQPSLMVRCISEFLGTFMLVITVGLNLATGSPATAWSAAAALMCMIYSLGNVSGGHFNPAVTLGVVLSGRDKCSLKDGIAYWGVQFIAGILAGLLSMHFWVAGPNKDLFVYALGPQNDFNWYQTCFAEMTFTFVLAFIVLSVATVKAPAQKTKMNFQFALCIGACVTAGGMAIGTISMGSLNPAVSWGLATAHGAATGDGQWQNCIYYTAFELLGGALAALVFAQTHRMEYCTKDSLNKDSPLV